MSVRFAGLERIPRDAGRRSLNSASGQNTMWRKRWIIVLLGFLAVGVALILFIGPASPAGRYEVKLPPIPMFGGPVTNAQQMHIYYQLSGGRVTVVSGRNVADFGRYHRTVDGWLMISGREDMGTVMTNKVEPGWYGLKVTFTGSGRSQVLPRCVHFWK